MASYSSPKPNIASAMRHIRTMGFTSCTRTIDAPVATPRMQAAPVASIRFGAGQYGTGVVMNF